MNIVARSMDRSSATSAYGDPIHAHSHSYLQESEEEARKKEAITFTMICYPGTRWRDWAGICHADIRDWREAR